jgi:hypothetical protein
LSVKKRQKDKKSIWSSVKSVRSPCSQRPKTVSWRSSCGGFLSRFFEVLEERSGRVGGVGSTASGWRQTGHMGLGGSSPGTQRAGGGGTSRGDEVHFIEETCTQGLYIPEV